MNKEINDFITAGIQRYKQATETYFTFRKELQDKLQSVLKTRENWGLLKPNINSIKSTTFGQEYPLLNSRINCKFAGKDLTLVIAVNWYQSENDFPFFTVWTEKTADLTNLMLKQKQYNWNSNFKYEKDALRFYPNPDNYNIETDFNNLLDEFIKFINEIDKT